MKEINVDRLDEIGDLACEVKTDLKGNEKKAKEKLDKIVKLVEKTKS